MKHVALAVMCACSTPSSPSGGDPDAVVAHQDGHTPFSGTDLLIYRGGGGVVGFEWNFTAWQPSLPGRAVVDVGAPLPALDRFAAVMLVGTGAGNAGQGLPVTELAALKQWVEAGGTLLFDTDRDDQYGGFDLAMANAYITTTVTGLGVPIAVSGPIQRPGTFPLQLDTNQPLGAGVGSLPCGDATILTIGAGVSRIDTVATGSQAYYAAAALGSGRVAVLADTTCVIDDETGGGGPSSALGKFLLDLTH